MVGKIVAAGGHSWNGLQSVRLDGLKSAPRGKGGIKSGIAVKLYSTGKSAASARCGQPADFTSPRIAEREDHVSQSKNRALAIEPQPLPNHIRHQVEGPRSSSIDHTNGNV
jgi:hypothetical protein